MLYDFFLIYICDLNILTILNYILAKNKQKNPRPLQFENFTKIQIALSLGKNFIFFLQDISSSYSLI